MVTIHDILHKIASDQSNYTIIAGEPFDITRGSHDFNIAITDDVETTEEDFQGRYGNGNSYYFRLENYAHGKLLVSELVETIKGRKPDLSAHNGDQFNALKQLFLYIHARPMVIAE